MLRHGARSVVSRPAALLLALGLAAAGAARAGQSAAPVSAGDFKLTLSPGLEGRCRPGWVPVYVAVDAGRDFTGDLVVELRSGAQNLSPVLYEVRSRIELAAGSSKDYHLYIRHESPRIGGSQTVCAYLQSDRGTVEASRAAKPLTLTGREQVLVCVVSDKPGVLRGIVGSGRKLKIEEREIEREFVVVQPALSELPDRAAGYASADFVLLCQTPLEPGKLSPERLDALVDYARGGGTVVLSAGDSAWFGRPELASLVPGLRTSPVSKSDADRLATATAQFCGSAPPSWGAVHRFDAPAAGEESVPGMRGVPCGRGLAVLWSLDPDARPLRSWEGMYTLWGRLDMRLNPERKAHDSNYYYGGYSQVDDEILARMRSAAGKLDISQERDVSPLLVMLVVVFYLVMVGPVNYFVLRRLDMRALCIATIPLLAAIFVLLTFALGYVTRGVATIGRRVTVAVVSSGDRRADCLTYQGVFPAGSMVSEISTDSRGLVCPVSGGPDLSGQQDRAVAVQAESGYVLRRALSMWEMAYFEASSTRHLGGSVSLESLGSGRYRLVNRTPLKLEEAFVTAGAGGGQYAWIGDVERDRVYEGTLARIDRPLQASRASPVPRMTALQLSDALPVWLTDGAALSRGPVLQDTPIDGFAARAAPVVMTDPRVTGRRRGGRPGMMLLAKVRRLEDFETLHMDGRTVRGEAANVLVILAEGGASQ